MVQTPSSVGTERQVVERFGLTGLFKGVATGSSAREAKKIYPTAEVQSLLDAGVGALRVSKADGGGGADLVDLYAVVFELARADPNIAHAFRNHFLFVEQALRSRPHDFRRRWLPLVLDGQLISTSFSEAAAPTAGLSTVLSASLERTSAGTLILNGDKYYSTGNIYADLIEVTVNDLSEKSRVRTVVIPVSRPGVDVSDDWDGIGQRLTGSGSTKYRNVVVYEEELGPLQSQADSSFYEATFPQLYLSTVIAGIVRSVLDDAVDTVQSRTRNYYHGLSESPRDDFAVQQTVGQISALSFAITATVQSAARTLAAAWSAFEQEPDSAILADAALDTAKTKIVVDELAAKASWLLFETGGASTIRRAKNLDRHWRNIRTISSHNPGSYKLRYIGDYELNGSVPPAASFF